MTSMVWLSLGLCALFFLAIAGIPLWFVLKHKEWGPHHHDAASASGATPQRDEVPVPEMEPTQAGLAPTQPELAGTGGRSFPGHA